MDSRFLRSPHPTKIDRASVTDFLHRLTFWSQIAIVRNFLWLPSPEAARPVPGIYSVAGATF